MREYLPGFLALFGVAVKVSAGFISDTSGAALPVGSNLRGEEAANVFQGHGIEVQISTVHAVKGETHAATLYMETFYARGGGGNYESERLANQLKGAPLSENAHDLAKQSAKMVYVGFSRPTHLLCFAVHESRFAVLEAGIDTAVWDVIKLVGETSELERAA
jgi:DNA helicase-2/ATP-dependent DNA helicase PcrA